MPAIFAENVANPRPDGVDRGGGWVSFAPIYTDALGPQGSPGETYIGMMQSNVTTIVDALSGDGGRSAWLLQIQHLPTHVVCLSVELKRREYSGLPPHARRFRPHAARSA